MGHPVDEFRSYVSLFGLNSIFGLLSHFYPIQGQLLVNTKEEGSQVFLKRKKQRSYTCTK